MTEERIKELIQGFHLGWTSKHFKDTEALIRTVAAEARKEGIEDMRDEGLIETGPDWDLKTYTGKFLNAHLYAVAEWLKEKGK